MSKTKFKVEDIISKSPEEIVESWDGDYQELVLELMKLHSQGKIPSDKFTKAIQLAYAKMALDEEETTSKKTKKKAKKVKSYEELLLPVRQYRRLSGTKDLILAEKDDAAEKMYEAFKQIDPSLQEKSDIITFQGKKGPINVKIKYWEGDKFIIVPARGHLLEARPFFHRGVTIYDLPSTKIKWYIKSGDNVRREETLARLKLLEKKLKDAKRFIIATDWDREGEAIGFNIARYLGVHPDDLYRMYFNALTPEYLLEAYQNLQRQDEKLLTQGLARGLADGIIGMNLTKAISKRMKKIYPQLIQNLSLGRVQSPVLEYIKSLTETNVEVKKDEPNEFDYSTNEYYLLYNGYSANIYLYDDNYKKIPNGIYDAVVQNVETVKKTRNQSDYLYDTNDVENAIKELEPDEVERILENLYLKGWLTYPRTHTRWVPLKMLKSLENELKKHLNLPDSFKAENSPSTTAPHEGNKTAIVLTPEGIRAYFSGEMSPIEKAVATRILERMIKTLAPPLEYEVVYVVVQPKIPNAKVSPIRVEWATRLLSKPEEVVTYFTEEKRPIPKVGDKMQFFKIGSKIKRVEYPAVVKAKINIPTTHDILRWMQREGLGTEATRHIYVPLLRQRNYLRGTVPTLLGKKVAEIIRKIGITPELTAEMERKIDELEKLEELPKFKEWIDKLTEEFIEKIRQLPDDEFIFKDSKGHKLEVMQYPGTNIILGKCPICNRKYLITY